jgi:anti-sigma factor RsiW
MDCKDAREFVSALIDGELAGDLAKAAAAHIEACPACANVAGDYRVIGRQIALGYAQAPADLAEKIGKRIAAEYDAAGQRRTRSFLPWAAALVFSCGLSAFASWYLTHQAEIRGRFQTEIIASHVRSLMQDKPVQIASSEQHTVKPWFGGKIDFSPTVKDLAAQGFPLVGARVDYVGGRRVAVLVYMRRLHVINLFLWPSAEESPGGPQATSLHGYNSVIWTAGEMRQWAVSDLNLPELKVFQALLE